MKGVHQILLCGFMGCGKTSVGQALSFRLDLYRSHRKYLVFSLPHSLSDDKIFERNCQNCSFSGGRSKILCLYLLLDIDIPRRNML